MLRRLGTREILHLSTLGLLLSLWRALLRLRQVLVLHVTLLIICFYWLVLSRDRHLLLLDV